MNRYDQILLHVGLSKTGSTSIQYHCRQHSALLADRGICYPTFRFGDRAFDNHSIPLVCAVAPPPNAYGLGLRRLFGDGSQEVARSCRAQLEQILSDVDGTTLVLSSERVAGLNETHLQALRTLLEPHARRLRVVAYIRNPESAVEAIMQERIKAGAIVEPEAIVGRVRRRCEALQRTFPDHLEVFGYEQAVEQPGGVVGAFLDLLGIPVTDLASTELTYHNRRLSRESFFLADAVNRRYPKNRQSEHGVARKPHDLKRLLELPGQPFRIPNLLASPLRTAIREEADWLASRFGLKFLQADRSPLEPMWQAPVLKVLPQALDELENPALKACVAGALLSEAGSIRPTQPDKATALEKIAGQALK